MFGTRDAGRATRAPLTPIPVAGPFDRIGVDIIQLPRSRQGNQYAAVFVDYLTKWPEAFPVPDQSAATVARLLIEDIIARHGVPAEILSDRGRTFLSGLIKEVERLVGFHKVNTSAYHPHTDGVIKRFNKTLTAMLLPRRLRGEAKTGTSDYPTRPLRLPGKPAAEHHGIPLLPPVWERPQAP